MLTSSRCVIKHQAVSHRTVERRTGFDTGTFLDKTAPLGERRTDSDGRLLVLGGFGRSGSVPPGVQITNGANNDARHDDVSDGAVTATLVVSGTTITAAPAWVLCAPPDFAPPIESVTSLYDVLLQVAIRQGPVRHQCPG